MQTKKWFNILLFVCLFSPLVRVSLMLSMVTTIQLTKMLRTWSQLMASTLFLGTVPGFALVSSTHSALTQLWSNLNMNRAVSGHPVFSIIKGTCVSSSSGASSKSESRNETILSLNIQRGLIQWVPQNITRRWQPAELLMECGYSCHMLLWETGQQVCVVLCLSADYLSLRNPFGSFGSRLNPISTFRQSCSAGASLFILIFISFKWLSIVLRDSCMLPPCQQRLFPQPWGTVLGVSLPSRGAEQLLFAAPEAWGVAAKPVQESLFPLTVFSSC